MEKKEKMKQLKLGVEIEVERISAYDAERILRETGLAAAGWRQKPDGSIRTGREFVSPVLSHERLGEIKTLVEAIRMQGGKALRNCGVHIHVDASDFDVAALARLVKYVHKQEELMYAAFGTLGNRRRYCRPISEHVYQKLDRKVPANYEAFQRIWRGDEGYGNRYRGLNLESLWTGKGIEYRYFNGSLNATKIRAYIDFCLALTAKALLSKAASGRRARVTNRRGSREQFRIVLLNLGLIGQEFKETRKVLMGRETLATFNQSA